MDDKEKSLFGSFADTIKNTFDVATEAASKALEPEPLKPDEELLIVPAPPDPFISDPAPPLVAIVKKKPRKKTGVDTSGRITPDYDIPVPVTPMPSPRKTAKKAPKKTAKKAASKAVKKVAKKSKKAAKKSIPKKTVKKQRRSVVKKKKKAKRG
jgi:hypothetical protein